MHGMFEASVRKVQRSQYMTASCVRSAAATGSTLRVPSCVLFPDRLFYLDQEMDTVYLLLHGAESMVPARKPRI